ncbi:phosphotransferase family protein [Fredinandcohnia humi]
MHLSKMEIEQIRLKVFSVLTKEFKWNIDEIFFIANGVVNAVYLVRERKLGELVVRAPWRADEGSKDKESSDLTSLLKEATLSQYCYSFNLPVPKVHTLYLGKDIRFLVSDFVSGDGQHVSDSNIGSLVHALHNVPVDGLSIIDQGNRTMNEIVATRLKVRMKELNSVLNTSFHLPSEQEVHAILNTAKFKESILHLDVRQTNMIGENGQVKAIFDWDNAFIGNPIMELMRISEYKEIDENEFYIGYRNVEIIHKTDDLIKNIFRLDTVLMLSLLFKLYVKDEEKFSFYYQRLQFLLKEIKKDL